MRQLLFGLALATGMLSLVPAAQAQDLFTSGDPFFLYYGYYLPRQQSIAAMQQAGSVGVINANSAERAFNAQSRQFDPGMGLQPIGLEELDPSAPVGYGRSRGRRYSSTVVVRPGQQATPHSPIFHNRTAGYYPDLRAGGPMPNAAANLQQSMPRPRARGGMGGMGGIR